VNILSDKTLPVVKILEEKLLVIAIGITTTMTMMTNYQLSQWPLAILSLGLILIAMLVGNLIRHRRFYANLVSFDGQDIPAL